MGPVLLQEETGVLGFVMSNCTTLFSHVNEVTLIRKLYEAGVEL